MTKREIEAETDDVPLACSSEFKRSLNQAIERQRRRRHDKQVETPHQGESSSRRTPSPSRKQNKTCRNCRRLHRLLELPKAKKLPPLPRGWGYPPECTWVEVSGDYREILSDQPSMMSCIRCDTLADHWDTNCPNPIRDPPETQEQAAKNLSWKFILRNFRPKRPQRRHEEVQKAHAIATAPRSFIFPKCSRCKEREKKERPLPEGFGYVPMTFTKKGRYYEELTDQVAMMSCVRCGVLGDHWDTHYPNPINDPKQPDDEGPGTTSCRWKNICEEINANSH